MEEGYSSAFTLLAIGMITVMFILSLVVFFGGLLIKFINRFFPEIEKTNAPIQIHSPTQQGVSPSKLAAIVSTVDIVTQGKGKVEKIEKTNN